MDVIEHMFATRVVDGLDDDELLRYLSFLEQAECSNDKYLAADATFMIEFAKSSLQRQRGGTDTMQSPVG